MYPLLPSTDRVLHYSVQSAALSTASLVCSASVLHSLTDRLPCSLRLQTGFELPARCKIYVQDFMDACPSKGFFAAHDGFMASKA